MSALIDYINEYKDICRNAIGVYSDSSVGTIKVREMAMEHQKKFSNGILFSYIPENMEKQNIPDTPSFDKAIHTARLSEIIERNKKDGMNQIVIARMTLVTIYQYWEDNYRAKIAGAIGEADKSILKIPALGDIRNLRNCIIHNNSIATTAVEKNVRFNWFKKGEEVYISGVQLREIQRYFHDQFEKDLLIQIRTINNIEYIKFCIALMGGKAIK